MGYSRNDLRQSAPSVWSRTARPASRSCQSTFCSTSPAQTRAAASSSPRSTYTFLGYHFWSCVSDCRTAALTAISRNCRCRRSISLQRMSSSIYTSPPSRRCASSSPADRCPEDSSVMNGRRYRRVLLLISLFDSIARFYSPKCRRD